MTVFYQYGPDDPHEDQRNKLAADLAAYRRNGGRISVVPQGATGLDSSGGSRRFSGLQLDAEGAKSRPKRAPRQPKPKVRKTCAVCGKEWETYQTRAKCCSRWCTSTYQNRKARERRRSAQLRIPSPQGKGCPLP